jgi:hypothetical protein
MARPAPDWRGVAAWRERLEEHFFEVSHRGGRFGRGIRGFEEGAAAAEFFVFLVAGVSLVRLHF